jgi:putative transcriptional regulator
MKWNLRLVAAQREIWKASQLQAMLADAGLVISAGKMSHLWAGQPLTIRLEDLQVLCSVLACSPNDLLILEQHDAVPTVTTETNKSVATAVGEHSIRRRHAGRVAPPL